MTHPIERASVEQARADDFWIGAYRSVKRERKAQGLGMRGWQQEAALRAIQQAREAGFAEGVERAAKVCRDQQTENPQVAIKHGMDYNAACDDCEHFIKALSAEANEGRCDG